MTETITELTKSNTNLEKIYEILTIGNSSCEKEIDSIIKLDGKLRIMSKKDQFNCIKMFIFNKCKLTQDELYNTKEGAIYAFYNEMYKYYGENVYKCGESGDVQMRLKGYSTYYITPTIIKCQSVSVRNSRLAESILFMLLDEYRIVQTREFFNCNLEIIANQIKNVEYLFATKTDNEIVGEYESLYTKYNKKIINTLQNLSIFYNIDSKKNEKYIIKLINEIAVCKIDLVKEKLQKFISENFPYNDAISIINETYKHFLNDVAIDKEKIEILSCTIKLLEKTNTTNLNGLKNIETLTNIPIQKNNARVIIGSKIQETNNNIPTIMNNIQELNIKNKCDICDYLAATKFNYDKHLKTKSHLMKVKIHELNQKPTENEQKIYKSKINDDIEVQSKIFKCNFCNGQYSTVSSLARHVKACGKKANLEISYKQKIKELENELNHQKEIGAIYLKEIDNLKKIILSYNT